MIDWLAKQGAPSDQVDTDGIYFVPPKVGHASGCLLKRNQRDAGSASSDFAERSGKKNCPQRN
jgi:hypothetical protein